MNNICGDGHLWIGVEECDDSNRTEGDGCTPGCVAEFCGDGVVQTGIGEECEGGSQNCTTSCGSSGTQICQSTSCTWTTCDPPSETCNGEDDDCDGNIDTVGCLVDIWRLRMGGEHYYAFHGFEGSVETTGVEDWDVQQQGTLAGPDVAYAEREKVKDTAKRAWAFFHDVRRGTPSGQFSADWELAGDPSVHMRLTMLQPADAELIMA